MVDFETVTHCGLSSSKSWSGASKRVWWGEKAVREYLEALDDELKPRKAVSLTDPIARWTAAPGGPAFFGYSTKYLVDVNAQGRQVRGLRVLARR